MPWRWQGLLCSRPHSAGTTITSTWLVLALFFAACAHAMTPARIAELRQETVDMFYHGYNNYMDVAFPEDELRPLSCTPLTRDDSSPHNVQLNDVLGNYSLTLIDSLSTLAILASAPPDRDATAANALQDFQDGVVALVQQYGDGTKGPAGKGLRAQGFDVDSKVQVFETVIRGVGGLVSAHLFAAGDLPILGYNPKRLARPSKFRLQKGEIPAIPWPNGLKYNGQLLRLALDLAERLLPAFYTKTGMPYPRVNLRHGIPFYVNSPLHQGAGADDQNDGGPEITETCSAGAGSLVLEFTVLSRLSGDTRFEQLAKRAFWSVWSRRSPIGLMGAGIDAESGQWIGHYAGIGAGTDSFFEYALKSHILLSGHEQPNLTAQFKEPHPAWLDPNTIYTPLTEDQNSPEAFLAAWHEAHAAVKRHLYSGMHHPHYVNVHLLTGSPQAYWIDSLGAYYPGLLVLAGEVEEAIETSLLYTALWTRYKALPERWSVTDGKVWSGFHWWPGRPEFIESTYHLYRATRDPWYLHVGEMVLEDIKSRCWTACGWSGLADVHTGEKSDRMESFFLGETAKYLYLLFDPDHPLNQLDAAYVFTTEGHPLIIPKEKSSPVIRKKAPKWKDVGTYSGLEYTNTCPAPPTPVPFTVSGIAARTDIFHAANLMGLDRIPSRHAIIGGTSRFKNEAADVQSDYTYYPWTLPENLMPVNGTCDRLPIKPTTTIEFPTNNDQVVPLNGFNPQFVNTALIRVQDGVYVSSLSGLKLGLIWESPSQYRSIDGPLNDAWRVFSINGQPLGRDEQILIPRELVADLADPWFSRIRDTIMLDIILQLHHEPVVNTTGTGNDILPEPELKEEHHERSPIVLEGTNPGGLAHLTRKLSSIYASFTSSLTASLHPPSGTSLPESGVAQAYHAVAITAIAPTGIGAAPIVDVQEAPDPFQGPRVDSLSWSRIFFAGEACTKKLPDAAATRYDVIVMRRGGCMFTEKLANIPSFTPTAHGLKLVIIISDENESANGDNLIRPLLDKAQVTPSGLLRHNQISMVMVGGGDATEALFKRTRSVGIRRRYHVESKGIVVGNIAVV
ncbi:glycoside hydrolase family 47 protein [Mollisia scopiformis]|uniref:alpha-1,2-Mannosidase n=1 Tax=Mollisia scopiformis TaxID=149040 RepID=A0A194XWX5_MOLSC|nr:glycoside hydrolase family 47 protein [Mollisia scopiformis]KUJ24559.1 glycoside hydrolase family 47 protein [Mollisia scopiformis]